MEYEIAIVPDTKGISELMRLMMGGYFIEHDVRPHITVGVFESADDRNITEFFESFAPLLTPIDLSFTGISAFGLIELFVRVAPDNELGDFFLKIYDTFRLRFQPADPHFVPGGWLPHAVIGYKLGRDFFDGFMLAKKLFREFECRSAGLLLLRREPYEEIAYFSF